jgi:hypothetical protein
MTRGQGGSNAETSVTASKSALLQVVQRYLHQTGNSASICSRAQPSAVSISWSLEVTALVTNPCILLKTSDTNSTEVELGSISMSAMLLGI